MASSEEVLIESLTAVRSMGITEDKISDEDLLDRLAENNYDVQQVVQNYYDGVYNTGGVPLGGVNVEMSSRKPPPPPPRPGQNNQDLNDDNSGSNCAFTPSGVCEDISDFFEENDECRVMCCGCWSCAILILAIILLACSLQTIDSTEQGLMYNTPQAILSKEVTTEGLHPKAPFGTYILWPVLTETVEEVISCLSSDGVTISASIAYQFTVDGTKIHELTINYEDYARWRHFVSLKARSGIRNACAMHTAQQYQTQRGQVQTDMFDQLKLRLDRGNMHANVLDLQLTQVDRPATYETAVDEKESAKNNIAKVTNARDQAVTLANTDLLKAQIDANKTMSTAYTQKAILEKNAAAEAAIVYGRYVAQAATYDAVRSNRSMTSDALLAYMSTRLIDELNNMTIGLESPAQMSYGHNLTRL